MVLGGSWEAFRERLGDVLGFTWGVLGCVLGFQDGPPTWSDLGVVLWGFWEAFWGCLGRSWGRLGVYLGRLRVCFGDVLGRLASWGDLGRLGGRFGPS